MLLGWAHQEKVNMQHNAPSNGISSSGDQTERKAKAKAAAQNKSGSEGGVCTSGKTSHNRVVWSSKIETPS